MASERVLEQKKQQVAEITEKLQKACAGVFVDYKGINVEDDTKLRKELREANVEYTVMKNTMLRLAVDNAGMSELRDVLTGTTAVALSDDDYTAAARILNKYAGTSKTFTIKSGFIDSEVIDLAKVESLAKLPSREVLLATVCNVFNAPIASFARAVQAIADKNGEGAEAPAAEAAEESAE